MALTPESIPDEAMAMNDAELTLWLTEHMARITAQRREDMPINARTVEEILND